MYYRFFYYAVLGGAVVVVAHAVLSDPVTGSGELDALGGDGGGPPCGILSDSSARGRRHHVEGRGAASGCLLSYLDVVAVTPDSSLRTGAAPYVVCLLKSIEKLGQRLLSVGLTG